MSYARLRGFDRALLPELGLRWRTHAQSDITIGWSTKAGALVLGFHAGRSSGRFGSDAATLSEAKMVELDVRGGAAD